MHPRGRCIFGKPYVKQELREGKLVKVPVSGHKIFLDTCVAFPKKYISSYAGKGILEASYRIGTWNKALSIPGAQLALELSLPQ